MLMAGSLIGSRTEDVPGRNRFVTFPNQLGNWHGQASLLEPDTERGLALDDYILSDYGTTQHQVVNLYVAYYSSQRAGKSPHSPLVCIPGSGWSITKFERTNAGPDHPINRAIIEQNGSRQLVYYWYEERGRAIASEYWSKWYLLYDAVTKNRSDGALVRLITKISPGELERDADQRLQSFIHDLTACSGRLPAIRKCVKSLGAGLRAGEQIFRELTMDKIAVSRSSAPFGLAALILALLTGCSSPEDRARSHYERAIKLVSDHENAKALIELKNAVQLKKDMVDAWRAMVQIDETNHDWPRVIADLRTIMELDPRDVSSRLKLGQLLLLASVPDEALLVANAGLDLDDSNADLHALKATTKVKLRDQNEALREAQRALQLDPGNVNALMVLAIAKFDGGDANGALSLLEGSSSTDAKALQDDAGLQLLKAKLFERVGDVARVEATLKTLVETHSQSPDYLRLLINFYVEQRRFDEAEKGMRFLAETDTSDPKAVLELVRFLYVVRKSPSAAREALDSRIKVGGAIFPLQIALANMDLADGRPTDARERLQKLISDADSSEKKQTARLALAQSYLASGEVDQAVQQVGHVLTDDPHSVPALKLRALIHLQRSELDAAISDLRNGLNSQPRAVDLMALLGSAYERNGLIELADKQFADATRASNFDPTISFGYADFLERRGNTSRAEDIVGEVVKRQPANVQALARLGKIRLARLDWDGASETSASIRKAGEANLADQIFGAALLGRSKYDQAIAVFTAAYNRNPTASQPLNSLVAALQKANKTDEAAALLKSILAKSPQNADALVLLGAIELKRDSIDQARTRFSAAVEAQPKALVGYEALANFHLARKDYKEAIRVAQAGSKELPDAASLRLISARASEQTQDYELAISQYQAILDKQPTNLIAANNLASLLLDQKSDPSTLKRAQIIAAVLRQSRIPQFKDTLGWASYLQGDYRNALSLCEEAVAALPDQAVVRYHLAMSLIALGQSGKASEQLKKALDLAPDQKLADNIRSALEKAGS